MSSQTRGLFIMLAAAFVTFFDRALLPPLLPVVATDLGVRVDVAGHALTAYTLAYAAMQLGWAVVASRWGRVRTLTVSTTVGGLGALLATLAADPVTLLLGRFIAGIGFAATVPNVLTYFGDALPLKQRGSAAANLAAALALGTTLGTVGASSAAELLHWKVSFGLAATLSIAVAIAIGRLPDPTEPKKLSFGQGLNRVFVNRWALFILGFMVLEGFMLVGVFSYLPVALQDEGYSVGLAGLVTALFGVAVLVFSQLVKFVLGRWSSWQIILAGAASSMLAFSLLVVEISVVTVAVSAALMGLSWAVSHTQMQTWMTDAVSDSRPVGMALFSVALFSGGSLGAAAGSLAAPAGAFVPLFAVALGASVVFAVGTVLGRARYAEREA